MEPTQQFVDVLYRERVLRARRMSAAEKFRAGAELFEGVCRRMRAGIRAQFPDADEARVTQILRQRLALSKRLEEIT